MIIDYCARRITADDVNKYSTVLQSSDVNDTIRLASDGGVDIYSVADKTKAENIYTNPSSIHRHITADGTIKTVSPTETVMTSVDTTAASALIASMQELLAAPGHCNGH
jgi:hypothetical protein